MEVNRIGAEGDAGTGIWRRGWTFQEDGGVFPDEIDGARGERELALELGGHGEREGFGGLRDDEILEGEKGFEVHLFLHCMV